jgi:hypothetical protein
VERVLTLLCHHLYHLLLLLLNLFNHCLHLLLIRHIALLSINCLWYVIIEDIWWTVWLAKRSTYRLPTRKQASLLVQHEDTHANGIGASTITNTNINVATDNNNHNNVSLAGSKENGGNGNDLFFPIDTGVVVESQNPVAAHHTSSFSMSVGC